jgi:hypothetical protein
MSQPSTAMDQQLSRIRALLAKAEDDAATPAEAEAYTAKAVELMAKYGVDRAMLADSDPTSDVPGDRVITMTGSYALDKQHLCSQVAMALGCKTVLRKRYPSGVKTLSVHLFGYGADLERAEMLFTSLLLQSANALAAERVPFGHNAAAYRRSWLAGYTATVANRLHSAEQRARRAADATQGHAGAQAGRSFDLVLVDRAAVVQSRLAEAYPKLGKSRPRQLSGDGYSNGVDAGHRAHLGGGAAVQNRSGRQIALQGGAL